jgi:hypothetical protein
MVRSIHQIIGSLPGSEYMQPSLEFSTHQPDPFLTFKLQAVSSQRFELMSLVFARGLRYVYHLPAL